MALEPSTTNAPPLPPEFQLIVLVPKEDGLLKLMRPVAATFIPPENVLTPLRKSWPEPPFCNVPVPANILLIVVNPPLEVERPWTPEKLRIPVPLITRLAQVVAPPVPPLKMPAKVWSAFAVHVIAVAPSPATENTTKLPSTKATGALVGTPLVAQTIPSHEPLAVALSVMPVGSQNMLALARKPTAKQSQKARTLSKTDRVFIV